MMVIPNHLSKVIFFRPPVPQGHKAASQSASRMKHGSLGLGVIGFKGLGV